MNESQSQMLVNFFKAAAQPERLQILGLLANRPYTIAELARKTGIRETAVANHLQKLENSGLARQEMKGDGRCYCLDSDALLQQHRAIFAAPGGAQSAAMPADNTLRHYLDGERIKAIPENSRKRLILLRWLADQFEMGVRYSEKEVNARLLRHFHDFASLRRHLVDTRLMQREAGVYWRS